MKLEQVTPSGLNRWQAFVDATPEGSGPYHHAGWYTVFSESSAVKPYYLQSVDRDGGIVGVLPMYLSTSIFTGRHLATVEGGALASCRKVAATLYEEALKIRKREKAKFLMVREDPRIEIVPNQRVQTVRTVVKLDRPLDAYWASLNKYTRRKVRKAKKNGFTVVTSTTLEALRQFFAVYARRMREHGTPVMGWRMMRSIFENLGEQTRLYLVLHQEQIVGGVLLINNTTRWNPIYLAINRELQPLYPTYLLYQAIFEDAYAQGNVSVIDLGRSIPNSGNHQFKQLWRGEDIHLHNDYYLAAHAKPGLFVEKLRSGKQTIYQRLWKRLPLALTNRLGPLLIRQLPLG